MPALVRYEHARALVEQCVKIDEAKEIMDQAAALQAYARQRNDKELENWVAEIKCRAAVQIGRLSREIPKASGSRPGKRGGKALPDSGQTKMEAIGRAGLTHSAVQRAEELAEAIDTAPTKAEQYYEQAKSTGGTVTLGGLRNALKGDRRKERESALAAKTEAQANQLRGVLNGIKAFGQLGAAELPTAAGLIEKLQIAVDGTKVVASFTHESKTLLQTLQKLDEENKAKQKKAAGGL